MTDMTHWMDAMPPVHRPITTNPGQLEFTPDQVQLIKSTICVGATDDELKYFMYVCNKTGLDPFTKQIYSIARKDAKQGRDVRTIQVGIDGLRVVANRTGAVEGIEGPYWCGQDEVWKDIWLSKEAPLAAKVLVWRRGCKTPFVGTALYYSYCQVAYGKPVALWEKMPEVMLGKCAEAVALRKAFPNVLSGIYAPEEIETNEGTQELLETAVKSARAVSQLKADIGNKFANPEDVISFSTPAEYNSEDDHAIIDQIENRDYEIPSGSMARKKLFQIPVSRLTEIMGQMDTAFKGKKMNDIQKSYVANVSSYVIKYKSLAANIPEMANELIRDSFISNAIPETLPLSPEVLEEKPERAEKKTAKTTTFKI